MEVFAPSTAQRRLLVELLVGELANEPTVRVDSTRRSALAQLEASGMVSRERSLFVLTQAGRQLAGHLADRMLGLPTRLEGYA